MTEEIVNMEKVKRLIPELRFGEFDGEWIRETLNEKCEKISDGLHGTPKYEPNGAYFFVNGNNLIDGKIIINDKTKKVSEKEFEKHKRDLNSKTILLSINGTIGNLAFYQNEKIVLGKSACYINLELLESKYYVYYYLQNSKTLRYFHSELTGTTIKNLSLKTIKNLKIPTPSLPEQQKIATFLSAVDKKIAQLTRKKALLEQYKKGVMQQLFSRQLRFKDEQGRAFPEWEEMKLGEVATNISYGMNTAATTYDGENKYLRITDIDENSRTFIPNPLTSPSDKLEPKYEVKTGDILFARTGASVGKSYLYNENDGKLYFAGFLIRFSIKSAVPYFVFAQTLTSNYDKWVKVMSMRSGQPGINAEEFKSFKLSITSKEEQQKIANYLSSIDQKINTVTQQITKSQAFKKGLLQQLFV